MATVKSTYTVGLKDDTRAGATSIQRNLDGIKRSALQLGSALGVGISVVGIARALTSVVNLGDHLRDLSKATGASVEQLSFLEFAATQSGTSLQAISVSVSRLQKSLSDVAKGGGKAAADALKSLGLNAQELAQGDLISQLSGIGEKLKTIQNPAERAAVAQALFGKGARQLIPLLLEGEDGIGKLADRFVELDGAITTAQADKFDALNDSLGEMKIAAQGAGASISESFAPALTGLFESIANTAPFVSDVLAHFVENIIYSFTQAQQKFYEIKAAITDLFSFEDRPDGKAAVSASAAKDLAEVKRLQGVLDQIREDSFNKDIERANRRIELRKKIGASAGGGAAIGEGTSEEEIKKAQRAQESLNKAQATYLAGLNTQVALVNDSTNLAKVQADIKFGEASKFSQATKDTALELAKQLDVLDAEKRTMEDLADIGQDFRDQVKQSTADFTQERTAAIEALRTPLEKMNDEIERLTKLNLPDAQLLRGIAQARADFEAADDTAKELNSTVDDLGLTFTSAFEDAVVGGNSLRDVITGLGQDILRLTIRKTVTEPFADLFSGFLKGFNFGGGSLGMGQSAAGYGSGFGFGNAKGGLYKVGGSGSEHPVTFSARAGEVVAVGTGMEGGGGPHVVVNNYGPSNGVRVKTSNDKRSIEVFVNEAMAGNVAAGRFGGQGLPPALATR